MKTLYKSSSVWLFCLLTFAGISKINAQCETSSNTTLTACDSLVWNATTYTMSGVYIDTILNVEGCDSIMTLNLTINNTSFSTYTTSACDSFYWSAKNKWYYTSNNTDTIKLMNVAGCDSIVTINLTINTNTTSTTGANVCSNKLPYMWNGNNYNSAGSYIVHLTNANGCDSAATLVLNILDTSAVSVSAAVCSNALPYMWNGVNYSSSGTYMWSGTNAGGCDSIVMLNLTIKDTTVSSTTASACGSYFWNGTTYNNSGTYTWQGTNAAGCDSVATLILTILTNIADVHINGIGAFCGDTAFTTLSTNIGSQYGSVSYEWIRLGYNEDTWQFVSNDSTINVSVTSPTQYVLKTTIAGCGTFFSNQETVMPIANPNVSLMPTSAITICNNNVVNFAASSTNVGVNNFAFYQGSNLVQQLTTPTYTTPILTTANDGVIYKVEATNTKPVFDGIINENFWGVPLAVSTFGPSPSFGAGHELNAIYARADSSNVYFAIAGNVQNGNRIMLFIDSKSGGYNTGNYGRNNIANNGIKNFNSGTSFDPGFEADYCLGIGTDATRSQFYFDLFTLSGTAANATSGGPNNYLGTNISPSIGYNIGANPVNNSQTDGFEFSIPKSAIDYTNGTLRVFALYSGDNGFLSNQFLTRANTGAGSYGNAIINFGGAKPNPIAIPINTMLTFCKASATTTVTVKPNATSIKYDTVCNNMLPYTWAGNTYNMAGSYNDTALGSNGCDSIATLMLTVKDTTTSTTNTTVCNNMLPYSWNGNTYNTAGTYTWKGTNIVGCDSLASLVLTISDTTTSLTSTSVCDSIVWNGMKYDTTGTYTWKGTNAAGCDSIAILMLTVNHTLAMPVIVVANNNIVAGQTGVAYSCDTVPNATQYVWFYTGTGATIVSGQFTTQITVDFTNNATSGYFEVIATNSTGCNSKKDTLFVSVAPLPVVLNNFVVEKQHKNVLVKWSTASEINSKNFDVQHSFDGRNFNTIATVTAKGLASEYQYIHEKPLIGTNYYKLKQVDNDGKFSYSKIAILNNKIESINVVVYPNPATKKIIIKAENTTIKQLKILNSLGKVVYIKQVNNNSLLQVNIEQLAAGTYYVEIATNDGKQELKKFIKSN